MTRLTDSLLVAQASERNDAIAAAVGLSTAEVAALFCEGGAAADTVLLKGSSGGDGGLQLKELAAILQRVQDGATGVAFSRQHDRYHVDFTLNCHRTRFESPDQSGQPNLNGHALRWPTKSAACIVHSTPLCCCLDWMSSICKHFHAPHASLRKRLL